jgi:hypothetical protein
MGTRRGNLYFHGLPLQLRQNARVLGHTGFRLPLTNEVGNLPAASILDPAASVAGQPSAVLTQVRK